MRPKKVAAPAPITFHGDFNVSEIGLKVYTWTNAKLLYLSSYCMQMAPPSFSGTDSRKGDSANLYRITSYLTCEMISQRADSVNYNNV